MKNHWCSSFFREFADFGSLARLGSVLGAFESVLQRLGGVLEASWSVLEPLRGVMKRIEALLKASWPDAENVEKPLVSLAFSSLGRSPKRLRGLFERLKSILKRIKRLSAS